VLDRSDSWSSQGGQVFTEIRSAMFELKARPKIINYIYGLGGREITLDHIRSVYDALQKADQQPMLQYLGVRE
jgi:pyruvate ferredoxin oxidoreductase alpha subunit